MVKLILGIVYLVIIFNLTRKVISIHRSYQANKGDAAFFQDRLEYALQENLRFPRIVSTLSTELTMFYYSFFSWRKKRHEPSETSFTFHKKTSAVALYLMLLHALVLESVGFHYLLHSWNPTVALILLILNIYTLIFLVAVVRSIVLCPIVLKKDQLVLQVGLTKRLTIPLDKISSLGVYKGPDLLPRAEAAVVFDGVLADFTKEKPSIEIRFTEPLEARLMYGIKREVRAAHLRPDEPEFFLATLNQQLQSRVS